MDVHNSAENASGNVVQAGSVRDIHFHAPAREVGWPRLHGIVPPRVSDHQPRDVDLHHPGAHVLSGPAGVGKTQIAAEFARALWDEGELDLLVWITASGSCGVRVGVRSDIVVGEPTVNSWQVSVDFADVARSVLGHREGGHERMLEWFATTAKRWLVVVDGVSSVAEIANCLPAPTSSGGTVITTRHGDHAYRGHGREHLAVGCFARSASIAYLESKLPGRAAGADELAAAVGDLPLALAQAGAYIADNPFLTCETYLARLEEGRRRLAEMLPDELPDDYPMSVATTFDTSIRHAGSVAPVGVAEPLLTFASMLSAEAAPLVLFTAPATLSFLEGFSEGTVDEDVVLDGLATLRRLNLITLDLDVPHRAVRVQPLLRRVVQERALVDRMGDVVYTVVVALLEVMTGHPWEDDSAEELSRSLRYCGDIIHRIMAWPIFGGWGDPLSLLTRHNMCHLRRTAGVHDNMEQCLVAGGQKTGQFTEVVARRTADLGADHPDTLTARHNLARIQGEDGHPVRAVDTLCALLPDYERVLGPDHPHTLTTRHNLAYWRVAAGQTEQAIAELAALVPDRERVLGPDHPHTVVSRHNLAYLREG